MGQAERRAVTLLRGPDAERAVAVRSGRIVAVGREAVALPAREVVDLGHGHLLPAFRDGHVHPLWGGRALLGVPLAEATDVEGILASVATYADAHPTSEWLVGACYDPTLLDHGLGDAALLDRVVADRPVFLWASDHHSAWVNTEALRRAGIDDRTPDPPRGRIVRDGAGGATGALLEDAAYAVAACMPKRTAADEAAALVAAMRHLAAAGLAWVHEAAAELEEVATYAELAGSGDLLCRANLALRADPARWREQRAPFLAARAADRPADLTIDTVKLFADGIIETGTAALLEPYLHDHSGCGHANWSDDELTAAITAFDADGFQVHVHAIGDAAVRAALDAIEHATRTNGPRDRRPVIAHTQLVHPDDLPRFAALGVIANFEPLWARPDPCMTELTEPKLGPHRSSSLYPMGSLARHGTALSFGSDWPVSSVRPLEGIAVATTRQTFDGRPAGGWHPQHRLPFEHALRAYTSGVAYQAFEESEAGAIAVGQRADLCLLAVDPGTLAPLDLPDVPVLATWRDGVPIHQ